MNNRPVNQQKMQIDTVDSAFTAIVTQDPSYLSAIAADSISSHLDTFILDLNITRSALMA